MAVESILLQLLGMKALIAARAVADAAHVSEWIRREGGVGVLRKWDASPVTVADFAVQAFIAARLAASFPDIPLVAEEAARELRRPAASRLGGRVIDAVRRFAPEFDPDRVLEAIDLGRGTPDGRYWVLDPIDGTKGFLRGDQYAVALALIQDGAVAISAIACPRVSFRETSLRRAPDDEHGPGFAIAVRGRGAWWAVPSAAEIMHLSVSAATDPRHARVTHSAERGHSNFGQLARVAQALGTTVEPLLLDSQVKHLVVAAARADLLLRFPTGARPRDAVWDHAAGALLVSEAGGQVSDLAGHPLDFSTGRRLRHNRGLLVSNGWLHDAALRAVEMSCSRPALVRTG